ncbi:uncharacterized protein CCOS01_08448 [Colletotrichum costaricense]|uniref:Uncharacterized protein n=1 Tax=Colletotrichum costaricense TaxID=1209916 RepID=A0AAJ0DZH2_9PEZI|nr:uncharacterized protein CCOS01_08448 [Colletotrichum costaricense]KAK1526030.1 hypothetical protein CCOS01_08448 [Colletotrichum costaricense]
MAIRFWSTQSLLVVSPARQRQKLPSAFGRSQRFHPSLLWVVARSHWCGATIGRQRCSSLLALGANMSSFCQRLLWITIL